MAGEGGQALEIGHEDIARAASLMDGAYRKEVARIIARASLHTVVEGLLRTLACGQEAVLPHCGRFQARMVQDKNHRAIISFNRFDEASWLGQEKDSAKQNVRPPACHHEDVTELFAGLVEESYGFFALTPLIAQNGRYLDRRNGRDTLLAQICGHWAGEITRHCPALCQVFLAGLIAAGTFVELKGLGLFKRTASDEHLDFTADEVALRYINRFSCRKEG